MIAVSDRDQQRRDQELRIVDLFLAARFYDQLRTFESCYCHFFRHVKLGMSCSRCASILQIFRSLIENSVHKIVDSFNS